LHDRAQVLAALGRESQALECFDRALARRPGDARALSARARVLEAMGRHAEALAAYNAAVAAGPQDGETRWHRDLASRRIALPAILERALEAWDAGRTEDAVQCCRSFLADEPEHRDALLLLAALRQEQQALGEALELVQRALAADSQCYEALVQQASLLLALRQPEEALAACERALVLRPQGASALHARAKALQALSRHREALASLERALVLRPTSAELLNSRGDALRALERDREALESYRQALALRPDYAEALENRAAASGGLQRHDALCIRAHALEALERPEEALALYEQVLASRPEHAEARHNVANVLCQLGRIDEAVAAFERVLALRPADAEAHFNSSFAYLLAGDYQRGWQEYEWRWEALRTKLPAAAAGKPLWLGEQDLAGRTLLIHAEQGFGDAIQMARYVPLLAARGAQVVIGCPPPLAALLATVPGVASVFSSKDTPVPFDYHIPIMSLPRAFHTSLASIPSQVPYVHAARPAADAWRARLAAHGSERKVGLVWAGNPKHRRDHTRSLAAELLAPLVGVASCAFFSLQKDHAGASLAKLDPRGERVVDYTAELETFADTAALISALDLVITVDTAVAHLAGALGKPVWLLLPFAPDARWMRERPDSPWYPSARLFRQRERGDWQSVIRTLASALA
jgi:tetratricopeptide (TPR) repeat protein